MEKVEVQINRIYAFKKSVQNGCDKCDLYDLCNDVDWNDCKGGLNGFYEITDETIKQL